MAYLTPVIRESLPFIQALRTIQGSYPVWRC